jgi:transcriptional regulator with XRE-family HTH domain
MARKKKDAPKATPPIEPVAQHVCEQVKALRKTRRWTLQQLAASSGVSRSMLSQIERGTANPTLAVAYRIAQAFGISLAELVDTPDTTPRIDVVRADDRTHLFRDDSDCRIRTLSPLHLEKDVEFYEVCLSAGGKLQSAPHFEGTREFLTVQKGCIELISGEESCELKQQDSAHYPADVTHEINNKAKGESMVFLVVIYAGAS